MKVSELPAPDDKATQKDGDWWRDLIEEGKEHGIYIRPSNDRDRAFIMAGIRVKDREGI